MENSTSAAASSSQRTGNPIIDDGHREFRALTSCRGIAALTVAIYHILYEHYSALSIPLSGPIGRGYLCVDFFFVLSGFVITYAYARYFTGGLRLRQYGKFMMRRIGRIYPLYFFVLSLAIAYTLSVYGNFHSGRLPAVQSHYPLPVSLANYLLIFDWGLRIHGFVGASWSISTEMAAYVVFPLLLGVCFSRRPAVWALGLVVAAAALVAVYSSNASLDLFEGIPSLVRCLTEFSLGIFTYRVFASGSDWGSIAGGNVALAAIALVSAVSLFVLRSDIAVAFCFPALVLSLARNRGAVVRLLETGPFHWLGLISYSLYLVHAELQHVAVYLDRLLVDRSVPPNLALTIATSLTVALILVVSHATYSWIEVPGRSLFRRISAGFGKPLSTAAAPTGL